MRGAFLWVGAATFVMVGATYTTAFGQASVKATQVIARAMTFLDPSPAGTAELGILYMPSQPASVEQANQMAALFGEGLTVGQLTVRPRLLPIDALPTAQGLAAIFVTGELGAATAELPAAARRMHIPTISTDLACVQQAVCTMGFDSTRTVRILLSHAACQAAGINFIQAFRILVTEQ